MMLKFHNISWNLCTPVYLTIKKWKKRGYSKRNKNALRKKQDEWESLSNDGSDVEETPYSQINLYFTSEIRKICSVRQWP